MLALRFYQRILLVAFIIKAAAVRPPIPLQFWSSAQTEDNDNVNASSSFSVTNDSDVENDVDIDDNLNFSSGNENGNSFPKTKNLWENRRQGNTEQPELNYLNVECLMPFLRNRLRLQRENKDKLRRRIHLAMLRARLDTLSKTFKEPDALIKQFKKRSANQWERDSEPIDTNPRYPYAYAMQKDPGGEVIIMRSHPRNLKRRQQQSNSNILQSKFQPSISAGAMTNLADFFHDLSTNVLFTEHAQLGQAETQLLEGDHPLRALKNEFDKDENYSEKTAQLLQAIRTYRPSQEVRTLVSRNPDGYRGSQFIDPSYMWLGLGK